MQKPCGKNEEISSYLQNCPLELEDILIGFWYKSLGHYDLTKHIFGYNSVIHPLIMKNVHTNV